MQVLRALAAATVSLILPGAGHALIRDWLRAAVFAGLFLTATVVFVPTDVSGVTTFSDAYTLVEDETTRMAQFTLSFLYLFAAIDAGFRALGFPPGSSTADADGPTCPQCGKELDDDLEFCHWCTTRLDRAGDADEEADELTNR